MGMCGRSIQRVKIEADGETRGREGLSSFICLRNTITELKNKYS
jgi:hypothetical protein